MKKIICCSDGTWNKADQKDDGVVSPTNVKKFYDALADIDEKKVPQKKFYDEGVGNKWYTKFTGGIFGLGINKNIIDVYRYIATNYQPGDEIYLFGFSRGAYTARSVAGFIYNCGLLKPEFLNNNKIKEAFELYKDRTIETSPSSEKARAFKAQYSYDNIIIKFIGVWDTVGSLGIPLDIFDKINKDLFNTQFYDVTLNKSIKYAYHALAIDEKRKPFVPTLWEKHPDAPSEQILEQAWFPGVHSDVGGGYKERDLSNCTLQWMVQNAKNAGLSFTGTIEAGNPLGNMHDSFTTLYKTLGTVQRKIKNGEYHFEKLSTEAQTRWVKNANNYQNIANPNIKNIFN
jgi:uncharacterized protein (DUF2235 family)